MSFTDYTDYGKVKALDGWNQAMEYTLSRKGARSVKQLRKDGDYGAKRHGGVVGDGFRAYCHMLADALEGAGKPYPTLRDIRKVQPSPADAGL